jgi:putative peptide zinc metalloprotease protein
VERSERRGQDPEGGGNDDEFATGNGRNEVVVHNCTDARLRVRASIQLNTIPGRVVAPLNLAYAEGSCLECKTLAVALQVDLYSGERAREVRPENYAIAINTTCTRCVTVARAIQYVQPVEDPRDVAKDISDTVEALDEELRAIQSDPSVSLSEAELRLNAVLERFKALGGTLGEQRDEHDD